MKGERRGTQCFKWTCKCCKGKFVGRLHKLAVHIAGEKFAADKSMNVLECVSPAFVNEGDMLGLVLKKWVDLLSPLHGAVFCLHPESKYEQEKNQEAMDDRMTMHEKVHGIGSEEALKALKEYQRCTRP